MILAAGRGQRMRPLTDVCPKPLLKVAGKPLIEYHIEAIKAADIHHIVINTAHLGDMLEDALGDGRRFGVDIDYSHEGQGKALETGGGILKALPLFRSEQFLVVNGDVWTDADYNVERLNDKDLAHLFLVDNPAHNPEGDFCLRDGRLTEACSEALTFSGIGLYHKAFFNVCPTGEAFALAPLIRQAIAAGRVSGQKLSGHWVDVGTPQRLQQIELWLQQQ